MLFKYSGRIEPGSVRHALRPEMEASGLTVPAYAYDAWTGQYDVPQYAPTVTGRVDGFHPAEDCGGAFMSCNYQTNNNCYAYACCIASNSFPQPGRATQGSVNLRDPANFTAKNVRDNAMLDGLRYAGETMAALERLRPEEPGHYVALLFSPPVSNVGGDPNANWAGDYHWARCDDPGTCASWSQKDGSDQVTNFDFAGRPITDPSQANWTVNNGPIGNGDKNEFTVSYEFVCFMWVPHGRVQII